MPSATTSSFPSATTERDADTMSDSDWFDIASGRDSEDADSVASRNLSRRSSISLAGTSDSAGHALIERWEGLIGEHDSEDESLVGEGEPLGNPFTDIVASQPQEENDHPQGDAAEEESVKAALEQSMISTLSSSRSSSHSFGRADLRLSFPDPILSNSALLSRAEQRDDLDRSYDRISPSHSDVQLGKLTESSPTDAPMTLDDLGIIPTPKVVSVVSASYVPAPVEFDLDITLYGCSTRVQLSFVESLLRKIDPVSRSQMCSPDTWIQVLKNGTKPRVIAIKDRTLSAGRDAAMVPRLESSSHTPDRPVASLAIIYLPSSITGDSIAEHTYYLPVLVPPSCIINSFSEEIERHAARHRWEMLDIPESKVLTLTRTQKQEIIDANQVDSLDADDVCSAFEALFAESESRSVQGHAPLKDLGTRVNVLTVLTLLLSVLLTYTLKDVRASFPPASVVSLNGSRTIDSPNRSVSVPQPVAVPLADNNSGKAMISSSMKDLALAIFDTGSGSGSSSPVPSGSKRMPAAERGARTGRHTCSRPSAPLAKLPAAELILRPDYSVPALNNAASAAVSKALSVITPAHSTLKGKGKAKDDGREDVTALSLRVMGSLSEWFDVQTILNGVRRDVSDLVNALEDLMHMLGGIVEQGRKSLLTFVASLERPTGEAPEQYEAPVPDGRGLREALTERHSRAKQRAKEIKEAGSRWMADVKHRAEDCAKERVVALGGPVSGHIERPKRACDRKGDLRELSRGILDYVL